MDLEQVRAQIVECYPRVLGYSRRLFRGHTPQAEDLAQDVMYKALRAAEDFKKECQVSTWLYQITFNEFISTWRRNRKHLNTEPISLEEVVRENSKGRHVSWEPSADGNEDRAIAQDYVQFLFANISPKRRMWLAMAYLQLGHGFTHKELGKIFHLHRATAKSRCYRALEEARMISQQTRDPDLLS